MSGRLGSLDVLRGMAILLVLFRHAPGFEPADSSLQVAISYLLSGLRRVGWVGVDLFFVLSGFLISGLLFKELARTGRLDVSRFWLRRGLKIWPSYFAAYGAMVCLEIIARPNLAKSLRAWPNLLFVQNYFPHKIHWPHSWSLAVEEHFYLALPLILLSVLTLTPSRSFKSLPLCIFLVCAATLFGRLLTSTLGTGKWESIYYPTHCRVDSLSFGVLLGYLNFYHPQMLERMARHWKWLFAGGIATCALPLCFRLENSRALHTSILFTALYLGFGGLVIVAARRTDWARRRRAPVKKSLAVLSWLGVYSYTVYLAHAVFDVSTLHGQGLVTHFRWITDNSLWDGIPYLIASVAGGVLLSHAVERPFLRLRERWVPSLRTQAAVLTTSA